VSHHLSLSKMDEMEETVTSGDLRTENLNLGHCSWECKMEQLLWKTGWQFHNF
jgi:hypothetical protein